MHLLGQGLPSFYVADLGDMTFTLGLSGWTSNDWSRAGNFDLLAPRGEVDELTKLRIFEGLKERWLEKPDDLASRMEVSKSTVLSALGAWTQAGRAIFDLSKGVYRVRELARDPLPMSKLRFASERDRAADLLLLQDKVRSQRRALAAGALEISGTIGDKKPPRSVSLTLDPDARIIQASCDCNWFQFNKLYKGPCEHILAVRQHDARMHTLVS